MMQRGGASKVVAVEANNRAFLKCLIVKQIFDLSNVEFLFGDFIRYMQEEEKRFDIVVDSGVLYHMTDPAKALHLMASASSNLMLWTHYFDKKLIDERGLSRYFDSEESRSYEGIDISLAKKKYLEAVEWQGFCGGSNDHAYWLTRESLFALLHRYGFKRIEVAFDAPDHPNGPAVALCATK